MTALPIPETAVNLVDIVDEDAANVLKPRRVGEVDNPNARVLRVVHISDTRSNNDLLVIPPGDILIHSGNFFNHDMCADFLQNVAELDRFFAEQPHKYKIFVAGNHEMSFAGQAIDRIRARLPHAIYLQDQSVLIEGINIYGSPWTGKRRSAANAFVTPFPELGKYWVLIPNDTNLLITHSPPHRILDDRGSMGCPLLRELVIKQIRPLAHFFGHTRQCAGVVEKHGIVFSNGSQCGQQVVRPSVVDLYLLPEPPPKTKLYKLPAWKEDDPLRLVASAAAPVPTASASSPDAAHGHKTLSITWPVKFSCVVM